MLDPSATLHSRFITAIQNAPYTHIFALTLVTFIVLTGAFVPLAIAFALALTASLVYQLLVLPPRPAPARSAVLITGAGTGLGFDMAVRLAGLGVTVYAGVWQAAEGDRLLEAAGGGSGGGGSSGGRIVPLVLDVTKQADIDAALATISSAVQSGRQRLYGLVSNAGYGAHGPIELLSLDRLRAQFEVNAFAAVRLTQTFLPLLRAGASAASPSRIVLTSSMNGRVTVAGKTAYCSSKHALEAIGDNLRTELYPSHIRTTIIEPGFFNTGIEQTCLAHADSLFAEVDKNESIKQRVPTDVMDRYRYAVYHNMKPLFPQAIGQVSDAVVQALFRPEAPARLLVGWDGFLMFVLQLLPDVYLDRLSANKAWR